MGKITKKDKLQCAINNVVDMLPDLKEIADAKKKYTGTDLTTKF